MADEPKSGDITIRLSKHTLKLTLYGLVVLLLIGVIIAQQFGAIPVLNGKNFSGWWSKDANSSEENSTSQVVGTIQEAENETNAQPEITEVTAEETEGNEAEKAAAEESAENTTETEEAEEGPAGLLPITGEISFTIDRLDVQRKSDDYARLMSVTYTIKNQDKDFTPKIKAYLEKYGTDDVKELTLPELEAGETFTETSTKLTFGYNGVNSSQTLKMELYDGAKLIKSASKVFTTP